MPGGKVAVIHTGSVTVDLVGRRFAELLPEARVTNMLDDSLINDTIAAGYVPRGVIKRMMGYFSIAEESGADVILCACSSVGEIVELARAFISVPIVRIDEAMAETAVRLGPSIGVVATVATTLGPTARLIRRKAREQGRSVTIRRALVKGAFEAVVAGRGEEHDRLILDAVRRLADAADVIVLAQVSMTRLIPHLESGSSVPVLSSLDLAVDNVKRILEGRDAPRETGTPRATIQRGSTSFLGGNLHVSEE